MKPFCLTATLLRLLELMCLWLESVLTSHRGGGAEVLISGKWQQLRAGGCQAVGLWVESLEVSLQFAVLH